MIGGIPIPRLLSLLSLLLVILSTARSSKGILYLHHSKTINTYCSGNCNTTKELLCNFSDAINYTEVQVLPHARICERVTISNAKKVHLVRTSLAENITLDQIGLISTSKQSIPTDSEEKDLFQILTIKSSTVEDVDFGKLEQLFVKNSNVSSIKGTFGEEMDILNKSRVGVLLAAVGKSKSSFINSYIGEIKQLNLTEGGAFNCENMIIGSIRSLIYSGGTKEVRMFNTNVTTIHDGSLVLGRSKNSDKFLMDGIHFTRIHNKSITVNGELTIINSKIDETDENGIVLAEKGASLLLRDVVINNKNLTIKLISESNDPLRPLMLCLHDQNDFFLYFLIAMGVAIIFILVSTISLTLYLCKRNSNKKDITNVNEMETADTIPNVYIDENTNRITGNGKTDAVLESPTTMSLIENTSPSAGSVDPNNDGLKQNTRSNSQVSNFPFEKPTGNMTVSIPEESNTHTDDEDEYGDMEEFQSYMNKGGNLNKQEPENTYFSSKLQKNIPMIPLQPPAPPTAPQSPPDDEVDYDDIVADDELIYDDTNEMHPNPSILHSVPALPKPAIPNFIVPKPLSNITPPTSNAFSLPPNSQPAVHKRPPPPPPPRKF